MKQNKQQTAVDWLIEQYNLYRPGQMPHSKFSEVCEQAKELQKKQHEETWFDSRIENNGEAFIGKRVNFEQYYNQTYGTE